MVRALRAEHRVRQAEQRAVAAEAARDLASELAIRAMRRLSDDELAGLRAEMTKKDD